MLNKQASNQATDLHGTVGVLGLQLRDQLAPVTGVQAQREGLDSDPTEKASSVKRIAALLRPSLELLEDHDRMLEVVDGIATAADQELALLVDQLLEAFFLKL